MAVSYLTAQDLKSTAQNIVVPYQAIVLYKSGSRQNYVESHDIVEGKMLEGKPISDETMRNLSEFYYKLYIKRRRKEKRALQLGRLSHNILYAEEHLGNVKLMWWNPPQERHLYFTDHLAVENN